VFYNQRFRLALTPAKSLLATAKLTKYFIIAISFKIIAISFKIIAISFKTNYLSFYQFFFLFI
jgi:hypothetical protein